MMNCFGSERPNVAVFTSDFSSDLFVQFGDFSLVKVGFGLTEDVYNNDIEECYSSAVFIIRPKDRLVPSLGSFLTAVNN